MECGGLVKVGRIYLGSSGSLTAAISALLWSLFVCLTLFNFWGDGFTPLYYLCGFGKRVT